MGKFMDGWQRAQAEAEKREAEKRRRLEAIAAELKKLADALVEDEEELARRNITLKMEHGALVLKRMVEPMAGVTYDPEGARFLIHKYTVAQGASESDEAHGVDQCAQKLGEYAFSLGH